MTTGPRWRAPALAWAGILAWLLAILVALVLAADAPLGESLSGFLNGAFGGRRFGYLLNTVSRAALIGGMALSVLLSFRAGLFNIGGEGQLALGGLATAVLGLALPGPPLLVAALAILGGMAAGALWAVLAGALWLRLGVPLLIGTLLLNYPAVLFASYLVGNPLRDQSSGLPETAQLPQAVWLPLFPGTRLDTGVLLIAVAAVVTVAYCQSTTHALRARLMGLAPAFARASGLPAGRLALQTLAASGALAGLVGAVAVLGLQHRFTDDALTQPLYAWTGILAVLLVRMNPWLVLVSAFFFAAIQTGASGMERAAQVPKELALCLQAAIILFVASRGAGLSLASRPEDRDA